MHFNSMQKAKLGWIPTTAVKTQGSGLQQYTLDALENASGSTYAVTIPIAANPNRTYWIEYRQPIGFDSALPAGNANGAQIRVANPFETCSGCQYFLGMEFSDDTELLDMTAASTPGAFNDARLAVGSTFTDSAYGITIQVLSADSAHLTLNVTTPGGSTTTSTTTLASSPNPAIAGSNVTLDRVGDRQCSHRSGHFHRWRRDDLRLWRGDADRRGQHAHGRLQHCRLKRGHSQHRGRLRW